MDALTKRISPILTTIKLSKKPVHTPATGKAPVRRADPALRDRSKAPPKPSFRPDVTDESNNKATNAPADKKAVRTEKTAHTEKSDGARKSEGARQRNHRYDGKLRDEAEQPVRSAGKDTRTTPRANRDEPQYRQAPRRGGKARDGFDASAPTYGAAAKAAYKSTATSDDLPRLSKLMAERGLCSRREADDWIVNGWVKVNGEIIETLGTRVAPDVEIVISGYAKEHQAENVTILLHKPVGYVSGQAEDGYEPAVVLVHPENQWEEDTTQKTFQRGFLKGLAPAGRLDIDSTGLLVLTQDGRVARHLIGEDSTVEKEYLVRVEGELSHDGLTKLNYGLSLDGVKLKPAKVSWQNEDQLRFVLREGKKRQIRRMCEMVGLKVVGLKRIRIGSVTLGKLPVGEWRYLRPDERF